MRDGAAEAGEVASDEVDDLGGGELVPKAVGGEDDEAEGGFRSGGRGIGMVEGRKAVLGASITLSPRLFISLSSPLLSFLRPRFQP